jgi:hypothetical protein
MISRWCLKFLESIQFQINLKAILFCNQVDNIKSNLKQVDDLKLLIELGRKHPGDVFE